MNLKILDAAATVRALPYPALADGLADMLMRRRTGITRAPERMVLPLPGGVLLAMPATDGEFASTKLVTVHAGNPGRGLPSLLGEVLLMRADTGERLLMLDGPTLTARRTAALSALAARRLAGVQGESMLLVGAGVQARAHLEAFAALLEVQHVHVSSRNPSHAQALVDHARSMGMHAEQATDIRAALAQCRLVVTATTATHPVVPDAVRDDAFVAAVGAYQASMCELPASLLHRAQLWVDDRAGAIHEAGDLIQAGIDPANVAQLEESPSQPPPLAGQPVVFKSVGQALWDLAAARIAWHHLNASA